ncbi:MAG: hypothetical protein M3Y33_02570 [Actinomycetota bacterium]|nr:hypothetical protein [Actinomycetota bacterium]
MSCCDPRGPAPAGLFTSAAIAVVLTVAVGGPLLALAGQLRHRVGLGWVITAGIIATVATAVCMKRRRARAHPPAANAGLR